jgi:hypothetical protein
VSPTRSIRGAWLLVVALVSTAGARAGTTLSGAIDVYLDWTRSPAGQLARVDSNTYGNTSIRVRSTDTLQAGTDLTLVCQAGVYADTGVTNPNNPCYLALSGKLGSGAFGEQYTPHAEVLCNADAFASSFWGTPYAIFVSGINYLIRPAAITIDSRDALDERVRVSAMFVPARDPTNQRLTRRGQAFVALHLKPAPDAYLGLVGVHDPGTVGAGRTADTALLAASWSFGPWKLSGGAQVVRLRQRDLGSQRYRELTAGLKLHASTRDTLLANAAVSDDRSRPGRRSWMLGGTWIASLSKLTEVYLGVSRLSNAGGASLGFGQAVPADSRSDDVVLGLRKTF